MTKPGNNKCMQDNIIRKTDYRRFEYRINPVSAAHHDVITKIYNRIEKYFKDRPECQVERKIHSSYENRYYTILFATIDDSRMFELTFAEYINTQGLNYD